MKSFHRGLIVAAASVSALLLMAGSAAGSIYSTDSTGTPSYAAPDVGDS